MMDANGGPASALSLAQEAMNAAPHDDAARLRFLGELVASEVFVLLDGEPSDPTRIAPRIADTGEGRFVLVFDREDRLADFAGETADVATMSGRALAGMLNGQGLGLALNAHLEEAAFFLPPEGVAWLAQLAEQGPREVEAHISGIAAPKGLPERLLRALDTRLAAAEGLARVAYLAGVTFTDGRGGHVLGILGAPGEAEAALARAVQDALIFSGMETGAIDVVFLPDDAPLSAGLARHGLRFDLPVPSAPAPRKAPGSDPGTPPILR